MDATAQAALEGRIDMLKSLPLFIDLPDDSLARIAQMGTEFEARPGQILVQPNAPGTGLFVIEEGEATVESPRLHRDIGPGHCFGELSLITDRVRSARVRAKTTLRCIAYNRSEFQEMLESEPRVALHLLKILAERLAEDV